MEQGGKKNIIFIFDVHENVILVKNMCNTFLLKDN